MALLTALALLIFSHSALAAGSVKPLRALLIVGGCCHDYSAQKTILSDGLKERARMEVDVVQQGGDTKDTKIPLYENVGWAKGYDVIIHDECFSEVKDQAWMDRVLAPHKAGLPAVVIHCAMHCYRSGTDEWFKFTGVTTHGHGAHYPHEVLNCDAAHPIMQQFGAAWWNPAGELYIIEKLWPTAHALASTKNQERGAEDVCVWVNQYGKTRVFGTTLGHHNETVSSPAYLDLVTRGTLWAAGKLNENYLKPVQPRLVPVNLALGKKASTSSVQEGHPVEHGLDGSTATRWCANGDSKGEWLQIDLGKPEKLKGTALDWESKEAIYHYKIEGLDDGKIWRTLVDGSTNSRPGACADSFSAEKINQVRVTFLGANGPHWASLNEVRVFGEKMTSSDTRALAREKDSALLAEVKVPAEFSATIFAAPPAVNYPVFVSAAPDGTLYVSSDGNGSLGRDPNRGRIVRLRDLDGDGHVDESKLFVANVDSPRGLVWDHDRLYLLHPPNLSAFIDHDSDGIADEEKILVKNIAFTFKDRPADHTSNGIELGVDGWIYCAIGDFGFMEATGTDGRKLQLRGGGVVRVRTDGTGLELFARGTRNILEVAVSPLLDLFARDNTNDGDGWDVRLHHFTGLEDHGYPSLYKNFSDELIKPLSDYGGGSGCGAAWIDEPGFPAEWNNTFYTADWGRQPIFRHRVTATGATFAETEPPKGFVSLTRSTDIDVDAQGHAYVSSWKGATFNWVGPDVGYITRVTPKNSRPDPLPNFATATEPELVALLESPSQRRRLEAQRTLLRRGLKPGIVKSLFALSGDKARLLAARVAALFALKQGLGEKSVELIANLASDSTIAAWAIRALTDHEGQLASVPAGPILAGLKSPDARTRRESVVSVARLGKIENAPALTPLLGDADPVIAHTTIKALARLQAVAPCFAVVDQSSAPALQRTGALRVLQSLHLPPVADGLITRLKKETDVARRKSLFTTLCRLHFKDGPWAGESWGTRPDTSGPYYQPVVWEETPKIAAILQETFATAKEEEAAFYVNELSRHKIQSDALLASIISRAEKDEALIPVLMAQLSRAERIPPSVVPMLVKTADEPATDPLLRAHAVVALAKVRSGEAFQAMLAAMPLFPEVGKQKETQLARDAFLNFSKADRHLELLEIAAKNGDPEISPWANAVLLKLTESKNFSPEAREAARKSLDDGWTEPKRRVQILQAVVLVKPRAYREKVLASLADSDPAVVQAAERAASALKLERVIKANKSSDPLIATMKPEEVVVAATKTKGNVKLGEELFTRQSCVNCHTVSADQPLRGPFLGNIATTYKRPDLAEAILFPNKTIAQGFVTHHFELKDGAEHDGFVTKESAESVTIRNAAAQEVQIRVADIGKREKLERSMMPEGLAGNLTVEEFASLLDYLEALAAK
ncbi:MAG: ThuA domain-containing protein [Verrucomicrobiota bacterium]